MIKTGGKRIKKVRALVDSKKVYSLKDACEAVVKTASTKFDETVDIAVCLGIDGSKSEQTVRGSIPLPNGMGKSVRVLVFAKGDRADEATKAGADFVGGDDLVEKIKGGFADFDSVLATPDMMAQVGKVGKILGPRGLMPSPKVGTVTTAVGDIVKSLKAGRAEFRADKAGVVHAPIGKASFGAQKISENLGAVMTAIAKAKPTTSKGTYLKSASLSLTMGPGVKFDISQFRL